MKNFIKKIPVVLVALILGATICTMPVWADEDDVAEEEVATSISISPVSKILALEPSQVYEDSFKVINGSNNDLNFEVYAAPYSYTYSEEEQSYKLEFNSETAYTQIVRWISFLDADGEYVETTKFTAGPKETVEVHYRVATPASIPAGGQYAVLFAHSLSGETTTSGIKVEASPGLVIYGRSDGETITTGEISEMQINQTMEKDGELHNIINATAKFKNTGNVDFIGRGTLKVSGIFGRVYYETDPDHGRVSIIPETEIELTEAWDDTPYFGLFNVEWTTYIDATGATETISRTVLILPPAIIVIMILLLTIIIVWIIIALGKRRERRSKFMV